MTHKPCSWYKQTRQDSKLEKFIDDRVENISHVYCDSLDNIQTMVVNYIQCVKLDEIEKREPWSYFREDAIKEWATPDKLRRLKYNQEEDTNKRVISHSAFHNIPMLSREYLLHSNHQKPFNIGDGIHRINRARELGMECILASIEEYVNVDKTDKDNVKTK